MLVIKCPKHPRYNGTISPRASCPMCIQLHVVRLNAIADRLVVVERPRKES